MPDPLQPPPPAPELLWPRWPACASVGAAMSLRAGGASMAPWDSLNLGAAVGDDPLAVSRNREHFSATVGAKPVWLRQVHGATVLELTADNAEWAAQQKADAAWTRAPGLACTVMVADCLPVLFAVRDGCAVAAAHAGWRGLAAGVLQTTVQTLCQHMNTQPQDVLAWLGPCIGPRQFEVGEDVLLALTRTPPQHHGATDAQAWPALPRHFVRRPRSDGSERWLADLQGLARDLLHQVGVVDISADPACTVEDPSRFYSFRRSGVTGRHACAVWRRE